MRYRSSASRRSLQLTCLLLLSTLFATPSMAKLQWPLSDMERGQVIDTIRHLSVLSFVNGRRLSHPEQVYRFYRNRAYSPAWVGRHGVEERAALLVDAVAGSTAEGLAPQDYGVAELAGLMGHLGDELAIARLDVQLTDLFMHYAEDLVNGRMAPRRVDQNWHILPESIALVALLERSLAAASFAQALADLAPYQSGYRRLKRALQRYREIVAAGGWPLIPEGALLKRGVRERRVALLRERLKASGDLAASMDRAPELYDSRLARAVTRFQRRHGIRPDGRVGTDTLRALNVTAQARLKQIVLTMERWRWLPRQPDIRYLLVNMAGFELYAIDANETMLEMRVIIGKAYRQTPVFASAVHSVVLNPYWYVPQSILRKDILPRVQRDPGYLQRARLKVFSDISGNGREIPAEQIDWTQYSNRPFPFILRQEPGRRNALGQIKFMLDNPYGIYLHDTPSRYLFERYERAYSSGCIRVEDPKALTEYLLSGDANYDADTIQALLDEGKPRRLKLDRPFPIYLVYLTAWVDGTGEVHFRDDIYNRDALLKLALAGGADETGRYQ